MDFSTQLLGAFFAGIFDAVGEISNMKIHNATPGTLTETALRFVIQSPNTQPQELQETVFARRHKNHWQLRQWFSARRRLNKNYGIETIDAVIHDDGTKSIRANEQPFTSWTDWELTNGDFRVWLDFDKRCNL